MATVHPFRAQPHAAVSRSFALAVIVPTRNEADNVARLVAALDAALGGLRAEIIFVDDWSQDGTAARIDELGEGRDDIRVIRRYGRRGLSSAALEGMMATMAPIVAVMDGDGQHDERLLPRLFALVEGGTADVAIGSRYCDSGSSGAWAGVRLKGSQMATRLSRLALGGDVADPMSGFFAIRRDRVEALLPKLSGRGFKLLFDLLSSSPTPLRTAEVPYTFRLRTAGESKLRVGIFFDYVVMVADRLIRRVLPARFAMFMGVGTMGLVVHLTVLKTLLTIDGLPFVRAQTGAVLAAIAFNFLANNSFTYRDRRLRGRRLLSGLASFYAVCGIGALANIGIGAVLFAEHERWWVSGVAGAVVGSLWNFAASAAVTWRQR